MQMLCYPEIWRTLIRAPHPQRQPRADDSINQMPLYHIEGPFCVSAAVPIEELMVWVIPPMGPQAQPIIRIIPHFEAPNVLCAST
jgi:hypothetical protein